jgi:hypothetical protein
MEKIIDALDPSCSISIYVSWGGQKAIYGSTATLIAVLEGYDQVLYSLQWQHSLDNVNWEDIAGETSNYLQLVVTPENCMDYWRVSVIITDVKAD